MREDGSDGASADAGRRALRGDERAAREAREGTARARTVTDEGPDAIGVEHAREHNLKDVSCEHPARQARRRHRAERLGQEHARVRRRLRRRAAPLPGDADAVRAAVPPDAAAARRRPRHRRAAVDRARAAHHARRRRTRRSPPSPRSRTTCASSTRRSASSHCPTCDAPICRASPRRDLRARSRERKGEAHALAPAVARAQGHLPRPLHVAARAGIDRGARRRRAVVDRSTPPRLAKSRRSTRSISSSTDGPLADARSRDASIARSRSGKGAVKVPQRDDTTRRRARSLHERAPARVRHRHPRARSALVLLQHEAGPVRGVRGHRRRGRRRRRSARGRDRAVPRVRRRSRLAPLPRAVRLGGARYHEVARALGRRRRSRWVEALALHGRSRAHRRGAARRARAPARVRRSRSASATSALGPRARRTLSGGEMQRLRLSAQLGSGLTGALYVLDEPTIGLHPRDTERLLANLRALVDTGSHGARRRARRRDHPRRRSPRSISALAAGATAGTSSPKGRPRACSPTRASPTARALAAARACSARGRRGRDPRRVHRARSARARNNLKRRRCSASRSGRMTVVAGVCGSGKSTLVQQVLFPALRQALGLVAADAAARIDQARRRGASQARARRRSVADRPHAALGARHVPRHLGRDPQALRGLARGARCAASRPARFSFNSAPRAVAARRARARASSSRDVVSARRRHALRGLRRRCASSRRRSTCATSGSRHRRRAASSPPKRPRSVSRPPADRAPARDPVRSRRGLPRSSARARTRSPAAKRSGSSSPRELTAGGAHEPTVYVLDEPTTGPPPRRRDAAHRRARSPRRARRHAGHHRAPPR